MKKNIVKITSLIILVIIYIIIMKSISLATEVIETKNTDGIKIASTVIDTNKYKPYNKIGETEDADELANIGNTIVGILQIIGSIISVVTLAIIGIKYMVGSVEEKAEYKKTMIPYVIGAVMIFAISNLLGVLIEIISDLIK